MYFCFQILPNMFGNIVYQNLLKIKSYYNTMTLCIAFSQTVLLENCVQGNKVQETLTFWFLSTPWYTITQCVALTLAFLCGLGAKNQERESKTARKVFLALVSFLARSKPKAPFLGLSLLRNQTETLATQAMCDRPCLILDCKTVGFFSQNQ